MANSPATLLKADLVDELYIGIVPGLLGEGIPLFPSGFPRRKSSLVENKTYSKGMIALKYKRVRPKADWRPSASSSLPLFSLLTIVFKIRDYLLLAF